MSRLEFLYGQLAAVLMRLSSELPARRRLVELQKQIPTMYVMLCVNCLALAATHLQLAPVWLTVIVPLTVTAFCLVRAAHWRTMRPEQFTEEQAERQLRTTTVMAWVLSMAFIAWAMLLRGYGEPYEQGHAVIFLTVTIVACILCLTHLLPAALIVAGSVLSVLLITCIVSGSGVLLAVFINAAFVTGVLIRIVAINYRSFVDLMNTKAEAVRLSDENAKLAHTDSLTDLPNRRCLLQRLEDLTQRGDDQGRVFALAIFDLDQFKPINDTYGHAVGDRVLMETAHRLAAFASPTVTLARLGGDEFGALILDPGTPEDVLAFCDRICAALQEPIRLDDFRVVAGCSCGVAKYPRAAQEAQTLFDRADYALYHSKLHCRGSSTLFSQDHEDKIRAERAVETALRTADLATEMQIHYQPILDTETGEIVLVEALARWISATLSRVPPDQFIAVAERCGMIHALTLLLLRKALNEAVRLPPEVGLSFNLSAHDLVSSESVLSILAAVRESGFDPRRLTLELTETALMRDFDQAKVAITALRALGIKIALDDFGTGYSSLGYVHRLPLDKIKIDRSFMAGAHTPVGGSLIATIMSLCRNLGLEGIAEGIETVEQLEAARSRGCRYIQGYLVGRPVPMSDLLVQLSRTEPLRLSA